MSDNSDNKPNKIDSVQDCLSFFQKAYPTSGPKNFRTQLGVFFEEACEMLDMLDCSAEDAMLIDFLKKSIVQAGQYLKTTNNVIGIKDRVEFLDGMADVMVTVVGLAYHSHIDIVGGFQEVNRSNNSKLDENGKPILDYNLKVTKGPFYSKPDLKSFV